MMQQLRRLRMPPVAVLAVLLMVGALVGLSAPRGSTNAPAAILAAAGSTSSPTVAATATPTHVVHKQSPNVTGPQDTTPVPTATDTPVPAPTPPPTPSPTDTPIPPTPTPTPPPSWHTIGNYAGSTSQSLVTLDSATYGNDNVRIDWTCTYSGTAWEIDFTAAKTGGGTMCNAGQTSNIMNMGNVPASGGDTLGIGDSSGGSWTATVEVYY